MQARRPPAYRVVVKRRFPAKLLVGLVREGTLFIDGAEVGQGTIDRVVLGIYSISEPFDVGVDNGGSGDRKSYTSPFKFGDTLNWVRFDRK
jgi:hypothetical protein